MPAKSLTQFNQRLPSSGIKNFDGSQLKKHDPERYQAITRAIQEGLAQDTIARIFQSTEQTINGIIKKEGLDSVHQANVTQELVSARNIAVAKLKQALLNDGISPDKLPVTAAILVDKVIQQMGLPSQVVRHEKVDLTHEAVQNLLSQLPKKADVIDVEPVEDKS